MLPALIVFACGNHERSKDEKAVESVTEREYMKLRSMQKAARPPALDRRKTDPTAYAYNEKIVVGGWTLDWTNWNKVEARAIAAKLTLTWQCRVEDTSDLTSTVCSTPPSGAGRYVLDSIGCGLTGNHRPVFGSTLDVRLRSPWFDQKHLHGVHPEANDPRFPSDEYGVLVLSCRSPELDLDGSLVAAREASERCTSGKRDACRVAGKMLVQEGKPRQALDAFKRGCAYDHDAGCFADTIDVLNYLVGGLGSIDPNPKDPIDRSTLSATEASAKAACASGNSVACRVLALIYRGGLTGSKDADKARAYTINACRANQQDPVCYEACRLGDAASCALPSATMDCALGKQGACGSGAGSSAHAAHADAARSGITVTPIKPAIDGGVSVTPINPGPAKAESIEVPNDVTTSSTHSPAAGYNFIAANLVDGDLTTCWQPEKPGPAWIKVSFSRDVPVTSIAIANGFQVKDRLGDEFLLNSRIATARVRFSDGTETPLTMAADERGLVHYPIPTKRTRSVTIVVDRVHRGTRWNDLAVSEIQVTARNSE